MLWYWREEPLVLVVTRFAAGCWPWGGSKEVQDVKPVHSLCWSSDCSEYVAVPGWGAGRAGRVRRDGSYRAVGRDPVDDRLAIRGDG